MNFHIPGLHHDHVDGSQATIFCIRKLYELSGKTFPFSSVSAWVSYFNDVHNNIVDRFDTVTSVLQSREALELMGYTYGCDRFADGFEYVEAKFAPQYFTRGGLTMREAAEAMIAGFRRAEREHNILIYPHLCIGREANEDVGIEVAKIAIDYDGEVALDLACDEANHPPEKHLAAYKLTFGTSVKRDCHAGEWVTKEPTETYRQRLLQNVRTAVHVLKCHGVGHAIPLCDDINLQAYMVANNIRVAGCPLSNKATGLISHVNELQIEWLLNSGLCYTVNADDDLFLPDMSEVTAALSHLFEEHKQQLINNVRRGAWDRRYK